MYVTIKSCHLVLSLWFGSQDKTTDYMLVGSNPCVNGPSHQPHLDRCNVSFSDMLGSILLGVNTVVISFSGLSKCSIDPFLRVNAVGISFER